MLMARGIPCSEDTVLVAAGGETFGTGKIDDEAITRAISATFDLRPQAIIEELDLLRPIYAATAAYGHFGRELPDFTWERTDRADALKAAAGA